MNKLEKNLLRAAKEVEPKVFIDPLSVNKVKKSIANCPLNLAPE